MKRTIHIIANGGAKGMASKEARDTFTALVQQTLPGAELEFLERGANVGEMVQRAVRAGATVVAAAGGDGTINAVASELVGTDTVLGVLPLGTLNHFSRDAGIPQTVEEALAVLDSGSTLDIDVGAVNDRIFLNNSGLGFYPDMVFNRERRQRKGLGKWPAVIVESVRALARYRVLRLGIMVDGRQMLRRTPAIFVGNNEYSLEDTLATKRETLLDGLLCLYVPRPKGRVGLIWFSLRAFFGSPRPGDGFDKVMAPEFTIETRHKRLRVSIDGEVEVMETPLAYRSRPRSLHLMVPRDKALASAAAENG